jgi:uncharacterized delta-60 repeat protein
MRGNGHHVLRRRCLALTYALLLVIVSGEHAWAAPGDMDPTFGGDGWVFTLATSMDTAGAMAILPDGKIVVVGTFGSRLAVWRFLPSGQLDSTFGHDGARTVWIYRLHEIEDVVIQTDGKLVVGGRLGKDPMIARLMPDGSLDPGFGGGDGVVTVPRPDQSFSNQWETIRVLMLPDGAILAEYAGVAHYRFRSFLLRLSANGVPDPSFGRSGRLPIGGGYASITLVDAGILVAGPDPASKHRLVVSRYLMDGRLDASFGAEGRGTYYLAVRGAEATAIATDGFGRIVLAGAGTGDCFFRQTEVVRLMPDGERDSDFTPFFTCSEGVSLLPSVAGSTIVIGSVFAGAGSYEYQLWISKLRADGLADAGFGDHGEVVAAPEQGYWLTARGAGLQSDGKLVVLAPNTFGEAFLLARVLVA